MKRLLPAVLLAAISFGLHAEFVRLVPESGISKAFTLKCDDTNRQFTVSFYRPSVFRVKTGGKDVRNDPSRAQILVDDYTEDTTGVKFEDKDGRFQFKTTAITVSFDKATEKMSVTDWRGKPVLAEAEPISITSNACVQTLASTKDVRYYGGGQQLGRIMHKGNKILIDCDYNWADGGAPNPAPFMISSEGFGILRHTFSAGEYDFTAETTAALMHEEERFDAFYFIGDFETILDQYTEATGRPNFLPMWGLELGDADAYMTREKDTKYPKQDKDGNFVETTPDVTKVAAKYRENDMPGGWLLVNDGYGCGHMLLGSVVHDLWQYGFKTGLWTEGALDRIAWEVGTAGTRIQKLDVAWTSQGGEFKAQHALQCNKDAFLGLTTNSNARAFIWAVLGWAGTQRYGISWAGDEYGGWDLIRYMIPGVSGSAMSGMAYATTDVDGIFGGSNETYLRDIQWKCWTTAMYVMNGWSHINKSPWSYPEPYRSLIRDALKQKLAYTPFFYTLMRAAWDRGTPIVRPMVWNYPDDPETWSEKTKYQFMVGRDLLVAPIYTSEKVNKGWWRKGIYLPAGDWYDFNDGRRVKGGQWLNAYPLTMEKIPVFVRAGAILPKYEVNSLTTSGSDKTKLKFEVWPDASGYQTGSVYEDDGETRAYQSGACTFRQIATSGCASGIGEMSDFTVAIGGAEGGVYAGMPENRIYEFDIHTQAKPDSVLVDGVPVNELTTTNCVCRYYRNCRQGWFYNADEKFGTLHVKLGPRQNSAGAVLTIRFAAPVVARVETPAYPVPTAAENEEAAAALTCKAVNMPQVNNTNSKKFADGDNMVVKVGDRKIIIDRLDGTYRRILGHVATHPDNSPDARFTFTIKSGNNVIFERANMKGSDVPQLIAVDVPGSCDWVVFDFKADDDSEASKSAKGIWKNIEFSAE